MKDFDKQPKTELFSPDDTKPPAKKRRVDIESEDPIDAKLNEIRNIVDLSSTSDKSNTKSPKKKRKPKNKNKPQQQQQQQKAGKEGKHTNFDYSSVDFKKFGGGSIVEQKNEIKMKFHGKVSIEMTNLNFN